MQDDGDLPLDKGAYKKWLFVDNADLLTDSEESALLSKLANISNNQQMDIVIVTVNDLYGETPIDYADDFYDFNCYAEDGVLLLISMENSDWYISTSGYGITAVTDAGRDYMAEQFVDDLGDGNYYDAFVTYADLYNEFINMARSGDPFDVDDLPEEDFNYIYKHIDCHAKPKESISGGSRTHTSSSGRTHGGGGGKF